MKKIMLFMILCLFVVNVSAEEVVIEESVNNVQVVDDVNVAETPEIVEEEEVLETNTSEKEENVVEEKESDKKEEKDKKAVSARDIISLIISFMVLGVVIGAGIFAHKENKEFNNKK